MSDTFRDTKGDLWRVRGCEECDGIVVERWLQRQGRRIDEDKDDPDNIIDIPPDVLPRILEEMESL